MNQNDNRLGTALWLGLVLSGSACAEAPAERTGSTNVDLRVDGTLASSVMVEHNDITDVVVTIEEIAIVSDSGARVVLRDEPVTTSLLSLAHPTLIRASGNVALEEAHQLRLLISGAYVDVRGEGIFATEGYAHIPADRAVVGKLQTPSFATSGLKVKLPAIDNDGGPIVVRFDVAESFGHHAGASGQWVMHPVIHAVAEQNVASIDVVIDADAIAEVLTTPVRVTMFDAQGRVEASLDVEPGLLSKASYETHISHVIASEGPFTFMLEGGTSAVADAAIITEPATVKLDVREGEAARVDFDAVSLGL